MIKQVATAALLVSLVAPAQAGHRHPYELYEDGSYSCTTDTSCVRAERAQAKYYRKMGWECLTTFDWRGCVDLFQ